MESKRVGVRAVILDWAGTTIDFGCQAPPRVFQEVFARQGIPITDREAREPMGRAKREHIAAVLAMPPVRERWITKNRNEPTDTDVERLYQRFLPLQKRVLSEHCDLIPGIIEFSRWCDQQGVRIGSTTGYTRELMEVVVPQAAKQGYEPTAVICSDDVPAGRPAPWMLLSAAQRLQCWPVHTLVAVDDTPVGIQAGLNAGCWTVAVVQTGNEIGLTREQVVSLTATQIDARLEPIRKKFKQLGAHFVIDSVADLSHVVQDIDGRLAAGDRPS